MLSATGAMLYAKEAYAGLIASKLSQTEGVEYEVVKEAKGFRVRQKAAKPKTQLQLLGEAIAKGDKKTIQQIADTNGGLKIDTLASTPTVDQIVTTTNLTFEFAKRGITPTQVRVVVNDKPRTFEKSALLEVLDLGETVKITMTLAQAKKWKLI